MLLSLWYPNPVYTKKDCPTSHYDTIHWSLDHISKYLQTSCQNNSGVRKTYGEIGVLLIVNKCNVCFTLDPGSALSRRPCFFPYITLVNPLGFNHTTLGVPTYTLFNKYACILAQSISSEKNTATLIRFQQTEQWSIHHCRFEMFTL